MIQFDKYFSTGLKPPTNFRWFLHVISKVATWRCWTRSFASQLGTEILQFFRKFSSLHPGWHPNRYPVFFCDYTVRAVRVSFVFHNQPNPQALWDGNMPRFLPQVWLLLWPFRMITSWWLNTFSHCACIPSMTPWRFCRCAWLYGEFGWNNIRVAGPLAVTILNTWKRHVLQYSPIFQATAGHTVWRRPSWYRFWSAKGSQELWKRSVTK